MYANLIISRIKSLIVIHANQIYYPVFLINNKYNEKIIAMIEIIRTRIARDEGVVTYDQKSQTDKAGIKTSALD